MNEQLEEEASLYVLDLLEPEKRAGFEEQLASDAELRDRVEALRESAAQWAHSAPSQQLPPHLEARILAALRAENTVLVTDRSASVRQSNPTSFGWLPWALAACLALACVVLVADRTNLRQKLTLLQTRDAAAQLRIAMLSSQLSTAPNATAVVVWDSAKQEGILKVENVPSAAADRDYQLWIVDPEYKQPVDAGVFNVPEEGNTKIVFKPKAKITSADAFAVSLERKGGVPKAEGQMVLAGK